jgi:hypothetical protein
MIHLIPVLAALAAVPAAPQEAKKYRIEATVVETAPKDKETGKEQPGFLCEGTTDLPDGCRIDVFIYYINPRLGGPREKEPENGSHRQQSATLVKNGRFSTSLSIFEGKNLSGDYTFRVAFDPNLQARPFAGLSAVHAYVPFTVGKPGDAEKDRAAFGARLFGEIKALVAIADEVAARRRADKEKGKPDPDVWAGLVKEWTRRIREINARVHQVHEYVALEIAHIADAGVENMSLIILDLARCGSQGLDKDLREGRERLDIVVSNFDNQLNTPINSRTARIELAREARKLFEVAVHARDERAPAARKRFIQDLIDIHNITPPEARAAILDLMRSANEIFDAVAEKKDAREPFEKLDGRLEELIRGFQKDQ